MGRALWAEPYAWRVGPSVGRMGHWPVIGWNEAMHAGRYLRQQKRGFIGYKLHRDVTLHVIPSLPQTPLLSIKAREPVKIELSEDITCSSAIVWVW